MNVKHPMSKLNFTWKNYPGLQIERDHTLLEEWNRLNAAHCNLTFLDSMAIIAALKHFGTGHERLLIAFENSKIVAMFVLAPKGLFRWQTFQPSQLPLGVWVSSQCSRLDEFSQDLRHGPLGYCWILSITQLDSQFNSYSTEKGDSLHSHYIDTSWIDIEGSFIDYWNGRGRNLRQNMKKQRTKLLAKNLQIEMQVLKNYADMASAVQRYGAMESLGWKAGNRTAIHPDNAQGHFYRELLEKASLDGEAAVYQLLFNDQVVAMNLCLIRNTTLVVLKTTYDESIEGISPAFLLREKELQEIFSQEKIQRIEYYGKIMDWHTKLSDNKRSVYHTTFFKWEFLKNLALIRKKFCFTA
jgi:Acetyltransferase (GNAT) domain